MSKDTNPCEGNGRPAIADEDRVIGGRYELREELGHGGVGEVLLALDLQLERQVAVKRIHVGMGESAERAKFAMGEAKQLARLQHPNIVTVFDVMDHHGDVVMVMEFLSGHTLEDLRAPLTLDDFLIVARQSLRGLSAAHAIGMIHLDIKPTNLMLTWLATGELQVKLLDFGLATMLEHASREEVQAPLRVLGSVYTMAPEQFEREPLDVRTDLYSLGCVFYRSLTRKDPFRGETVEEIIQSHLRHDLRPLSTRRPDLSPLLCAAIENMMAFNPDDRPSSALDALAGLLESLSEPSQSDGGNLWAASRSVPSETTERVQRIVEIELPDVEKLRENQGEAVVAEGVVRHVWENMAGTIRFLNFEDLEHSDFAAVLLAKNEPPEFSPECLHALIGARIRIMGVISEFHGSPQILVDSPSQISQVNQ